VNVGSNVTITATSNVDVGPTPYYITIFQSGVIVSTCGSGITCTYTANSATAATRSFYARISNSDGSGSQIQSTPVNVTWNAGDTGTDNATYVGEGTPYDNTHFSLNATFSKCWTIRNSGTTTWTSGYRAHRIGGGYGPSDINVGGSVSPNGTTSICGSFQAPGTSGTYRATYQLQAPSGSLFGQTFWVQIIVDGSSTSGDRLLSGQQLTPGQSIVSANGCFRFIYQTDGNLVLYRTNGNQAVWASNTVGSARNAIMQTDGNLVVYNANGSAVWASNTAGNSGGWLIVQNDGNVVIYRPNGGPAIWATNTVRSC
jgi:hypothetical protein